MPPRRATKKAMEDAKDELGLISVIVSFGAGRPQILTEFGFTRGGQRMPIEMLSKQTFVRFLTDMIANDDDLDNISYISTAIHNGNQPEWHKKQSRFFTPFYKGGDLYEYLTDEQKKCVHMVEIVEDLTITPVVFKKPRLAVIMPQMNVKLSDGVCINYNYNLRKRTPKAYKD